MNITYSEWAKLYPHAARDLGRVLAPAHQLPVAAEGDSETWSQQQVRFKAARAGGLA